MPHTKKEIEMEKEEINAGNKLIAEFMGAKPSTVDNDKRYLRFTEPHAGTDTYAFYPWNLKYHTSWDWLMPVVEKIAKDYDVSISSVGMWACFINRKDSDPCDSVADFGGFDPMILNVWKAVVRFVEWHNRSIISPK